MKGHGSGCGLICFAGQASAGPSGKQSQQAAHGDGKADGAKAGIGKRVATAHEDDSQVQIIMIKSLKY